MIPQMTPYERVMAAINGKEFDVFPAINPTSIATLSAMKMAKSYFPTAHTNAEKMAQLAAVGHDHFGFDSCAPYYSVHLECQALGAKVDWQDQSNTPYVLKKPMGNIDDLNVPPNFLQRSEFQELLKAIAILKEKYNNDVPVIGKVIGPWTLAYLLYGVENLTLDIVLEPEKTAQLIRDLSVVPIAFAKAQFAAGADLVTWADHTTSDIVSASVYEKFVLPIHQKAAVELNKYGPIVLHMCGNIMDRLPHISKTGFPIFHMDSRNNIEKALEIVQDKMLITGCINNPHTLCHGDTTLVKKEVIDNLQKGISLIAPECALPCNVPSENLLTLTKTTHQYTRSGADIRRVF